jgi:GNAT superfamily N-acetyltransferase
MSLQIRSANAADAGIVHGFVVELAEYEKLAANVKATPAHFARTLADSKGGPFALIAEVDGEPIGFALWFFNFSTFEGRRGVYLEDLYVREADRGKGAGKAMLSALARIAVENDCARLEWSVLDWNAPSIAFYESLGAAPMSEWTVYRLTDGPLAALAKSNAA